MALKNSVKFNEKGEFIFKESFKNKFFEKKDSTLKIILIYFVLLVMCFITVYPLISIVTVSLRPGNELFQSNLRIIPEHATLSNFKNAIFEKDLLLWMRNSLIVSVLTGIFGVILATTAGYAYSRFKFFADRGTLTVFLLTQIFPAPMLLLPTFILLAKLHLLNSFLGLLIPYTATAVPFCVWMLKGFFDTIPRSLEESAYIDGAGIFRTFVTIILPLSKPALAITVLFSFMTAWNEYIISRVIITKSQMYTLPVGLVGMQSQFNTEWGVYAASAILTAIPAMILFMSLSKFLVGGLTVGSVKG